MTYHSPRGAQASLKADSLFLSRFLHISGISLAITIVIGERF